MNDERPDSYEVESGRVHTMVHQLTRVLERDHLTPVDKEHVETARDWLLDAMGDDDANY